MNIDIIKFELIDWIMQLNDQRSISKLLHLKEELNDTKSPSPKIFGSGKHLIESISDDFNSPLDMFKEYQK